MLLFNALLQQLLQVCRVCLTNYTKEAADMKSFLSNFFYEIHYFKSGVPLLTLSVIGQMAIYITPGFFFFVWKVVNTPVS